MVNAKDEKELEEKLSKKYESPVSVLIIDCIDMRNRTHNAEISGKYFRATVNIFWVDELEAIE